MPPVQPQLQPILRNISRAVGDALNQIQVKKTLANKIGSPAFVPESLS